MRKNKITGLLTRMFLVVSLLFGVFTFTGTTADAQFRRGRVIVRPRVFFYPRPFYRPYWYTSSYYPLATHVTEGEGYKDGRDDGKDDAKHHKGYDPYRHGDYKNAQTSAYLDGYIRGYADGFRERAG